MGEELRKGEGKEASQRLGKGGEGQSSSPRRSSREVRRTLDHFTRRVECASQETDLTRDY